MYHLTIYDWFLTIDSELTFIWNPKWNLGTLLYFFTRYPTFIDTAVMLYSAAGYSIPPPVCNLAIAVSYWMFLFGIVVAEVIMMICVWAMCQDIITSAGTHDKTFIDFLALASLEVVLFLLMLSKAVEHSRSHSSAFVIECFRHGLLYYVVLCGGADDPLLSTQRTFHAILSARMLLHLRRSARQTSGTDISSISPGSEMAFRDGPNSMGDGTSDRGRISVI
ncbi:hypothetical protein BD779DRAFT_1568403 [Infundibulicybe gibba]|nr:hypothetical protein BD779DRAFT_1568403 [Infundibulicybe gibba]